VQLKETSFLGRITLRPTLHFQFHSRPAARILISLSWKDTCAPVPINNPFYPCLPCLSLFPLSFPTREDTYFQVLRVQALFDSAVLFARRPVTSCQLTRPRRRVLVWFTVCREHQCESGRFDSSCQRVPTNFVIQLQLDAKCSVTLCHEFTWKLKDTCLIRTRVTTQRKRIMRDPLLYHVQSWSIVIFSCLLFVIKN